MSKTHTQFDNISDLLGRGDIHNVLSNLLLYVLDYYSIMIHMKFHSIMRKTVGLQENCTEAKITRWRKKHLKFCYIYMNNASIAQHNAFFVYK